VRLGGWRRRQHNISRLADYGDDRMTATPTVDTRAVRTGDSFHSIRYFVLVFRTDLF